MMVTVHHQILPHKVKEKKKNNKDKNNKGKRKNAEKGNKIDHSKICKLKSKPTWLKKESNLIFSFQKNK